MKIILFHSLLIGYFILNVAIAGSLYPLKAFNRAATPQVFVNGRDQAQLSPTVDGCLYFVAESSSVELWKSCGVSQGDTQLVKSLFPRSNQETLTSIFVYADGGMFFSVNEPGKLGLWFTDGTSAGTMRLDTPAILSNLPNGAADLYFNGVVLLFTASNGLGRELWKAEKGVAGEYELSLVKDIFPGSASSAPKHFASLHGFTIFAAEDGLHNRELWRTDGTEGGTYLLRDIASPIDSGCNFPGLLSGPRELVELNGFIYFSACGDGLLRELWRTDGTEEGTLLFKRFSFRGFNDIILPDANVRHLSVVGDDLYFTFTFSVGGGRHDRIQPGVAKYESDTDQFIFPNAVVKDQENCFRVSTSGPFVRLSDRVLLKRKDFICSSFDGGPEDVAEYDPNNNQVYNFLPLSDGDAANLAKSSVSPNGQNVAYSLGSTGIREVMVGASTNELLVPRSSGDVSVEKLTYLDEKLLLIANSDVLNKGWLLFVNEHKACVGGSNCIDSDLDGDGVASEVDNCPMIANANQANLDGDQYGDVCDEDIDGDSMPNSYERANGLNPFDRADALQDADSDGFTNLQEYGFGTDPQSADTDRANNGIPDSVDGARIAPISEYILQE